MSKTNTTLTFTPDSDPANPITIPASNLRAIIPVYPDKRTNVWLNTGAAGIPAGSGHAAWLTVIAVDLPLLPVGSGVIHVQTTATLPENVSGINGEDISLEILPGLGASSTFKYVSGNNQYTEGNLASLEQMPFYLIKPDHEPYLSSTWPLYGAVEIIITGEIIPSSTTDAQIDASMMLFHDDMKDNIKSQFTMTWKRNGNETVVRIVSPTGQLEYYELNLSIVFATRNLSYSSIPLISTRYFDINGDEVAGPVIKATYQTN